jgi:hypothetical protein
MSPWVSTMRWPSMSKRMRTAMRLKISGASPSAPGRTIVPPERPSCQFGTVSLGGSRCASSVMRF